MLRAITRGAAFMAALVGGAAKLVVGCALLAWRTLFGVLDFARARWVLRGGTLHCPIGHEVGTEGATYECTACGYVYGGRRASIWECGNVECRAITPFISCPTCGRSCRNPYRWGRP